MTPPRLKSPRLPRKSSYSSVNSRVKMIPRSPRNLFHDFGCLLLRGVLRDVGLGHDPAAATLFIDHGDAPNLILLHHPATVLYAQFRGDGHAGAGHAIARRHLHRVLAFGHGPAADVAIGHDSHRLHTLPVLNHR